MMILKNGKFARKQSKRFLRRNLLSQVRKQQPTPQPSSLVYAKEGPVNIHSTNVLILSREYWTTNV